MAEVEKCGNCEYWKSVKSECHRYPPMADKWSKTNEDDWCGEFKEKTGDLASRHNFT